MTGEWAACKAWCAPWGPAARYDPCVKGAGLRVGVVAVQRRVPLLAGQDAVVRGGLPAQPAVYAKACKRGLVGMWRQPFGTARLLPWNPWPFDPPCKPLQAQHVHASVTETHQTQRPRATWTTGCWRGRGKCRTAYSGKTNVTAMTVLARQTRARALRHQRLQQQPLCGMHEHEAPPLAGHPRSWCSGPG